MSTAGTGSAAISRWRTATSRRADVTIAQARSGMTSRSCVAPGNATTLWSSIDWRAAIERDLERDRAGLYAIYEEVIRGRLKPLPGAVELVHACLGRGLAIAVASGADRVKVVANLREIGLPESLFGTVVDGNQVVG